MIMSVGDREGQNLSSEENRNREYHILVVLDGAFTDVGIVEPVDISWAHILKRIGFEDRRYHAWPTGRDMATDNAAAGIVDANKVVLFFLDEGRHGTAFHEQFHLPNRRLQASTNDFQYYRIDRHDLTSECR